MSASYDLESLRGLEKRLAEAKGPDREIDRQLAVVDGWRAHEEGHPDYAPKFTASLDAAIALVERVLPGWFWRVGHSTLYGGWAHLNRVHPDHCNPEDVSSADAAAPALALCLAIVRALIAEQSK